jgi:putative sterol carrier protein
VLIARGELDLHAGFMQGRVKMSGDMGRLMAVLPCTQSDEFRAALAEVASTTEF